MLGLTTFNVWEDQICASAIAANLDRQNGWPPLDWLAPCSSWAASATVEVLQLWKRLLLLLRLLCLLLLFVVPAAVAAALPADVPAEKLPMNEVHGVSKYACRWYVGTGTYMGDRNCP